MQSKDKFGGASTPKQIEDRESQKSLALKAKLLHTLIRFL